MTLVEVHRETDPASGLTMRILERGGPYPGFVIERLSSAATQRGADDWDRLFNEDTLESAKELVRLLNLHEVERRSLPRPSVLIESWNKPSTPWGSADYGYSYAEGVISYGTPSHGGYHLDEERNAKVHEAWRAKDGWYEEDEEWAIVAATFPELYTTWEKGLARRTLVNGRPHEFMQVTGEVLQPSESRTLRREIFQRDNAQNWVVISATGLETGATKVTATLGGRYGNSPEKIFILPPGEYVMGEFGFVIDLARHPELPAA